MMRPGNTMEGQVNRLKCVKRTMYGRGPCVDPDVADRLLRIVPYF